MNQKIKIGGLLVAVLAAVTILFGCWPQRYNCQEDSYDCDNLNQEQAQKILEYCIEKTGLDIHNLDPDNNNSACD